MRLAAHTFGFVWQTDAETAFATIAELGFTRVQLMATPPHFDPWSADRARTARLRNLLEQTGLELLAADLASSDVNLASASEDVVAFSVEAHFRLISRSAELGARWVCLGSGRRHPLLTRANQQLMETFRAAFARIVQETERHGIGVILENHPQGLLADALSIQRFLAQEGYSNVPIIYDVSNALAIGEDPVEGMRILGRRLAIVHVSDSRPGQWRHDPIGSGAIDFRTIGACLAEMRFDGSAVLEILSDDPGGDLVDGRNRLRDAGWCFRA